MPSGEIDFDILREDWSVYTLESETTLRSRLSVRGMAIDDKTKQLKPIFKTDYKLTVSEKDRGPPDEKFEPGTLTDADLIGKAEFKTLREPINVYDVPAQNAIVLVKAFMSEIGRTERFNRKGARIYKSKIIVAVGVIPYPTPPKQMPAGTGEANPSVES